MSHGQFHPYCSNSENKLLAYPVDLFTILYTRHLELHVQSLISFLQCSWLARQTNLMSVLKERLQKSWDFMQTGMSVVCQRPGESLTFAALFDENNFNWPKINHLSSPTIQKSSPNTWSVIGSWTFMAASSAAPQWSQSAVKWKKRQYNLSLGTERPKLCLSLWDRISIGEFLDVSVNFAETWLTIK